VVDGTAADVTALMANVSAQEQEIESLLQSRISDLPSNQQTTDPLQSLWDDMRDGHAVLSTFTDALLGKAKLFHEFMEKMAAQEQLLEELTELSTTYKQDLKDLASEPQAQQSIQEILNGLSKNYQSLQIKINELSANNQEILMKNNYYHTFSDQYRAFFETLQNLKIDNLRMSEKLRMQEPKLEWLRREKACVEEEIERLKGLDEAHRASRRKAAHLEEQLQRANEENQRLKGELTALTAEYLKLFERQST
jgi:chromosome segregation ATPase